MAEAYEAPMPGSLDLGGGYTVRLTAINPTTGVVVPNVQVGGLVMLAEPGPGSSSADLTYGDFQLASEPYGLVPGPGT